MKLAVIGSRSIGSFDLQSVIDTIPSEIISGGAVGIDSLAERFALDNNILLTILKPDYKKYGRAAPHIRNREIIDSCDAVLAIWDGVSRGTKETIEYAKRKGRPVKVICSKCR